MESIWNPFIQSICAWFQSPKAFATRYFRTNNWLVLKTWAFQSLYGGTSPDKTDFVRSTLPTTQHYIYFVGFFKKKFAPLYQG